MKRNLFFENVSIVKLKRNFEYEVVSFRASSFLLLLLPTHNVQKLTV